MIENELQNTLRERFNPEGSPLREHQLCMLKMLVFFDKICKKHNIKYWLCSGTLIGAVRHNGFIPWDDDLDVEMLRDDFNKLKKVMASYENERYALQTHSTDRGYVAPYGKLRDTHSLIIEENGNDKYYKYKGVYIDVFIIDKSSSSSVIKWTNRFQEHFLFRPNKRIQNDIIRKVYIESSYYFFNSILFPLLRCFSSLTTKEQYRLALGSCFTMPRYINDIFPLSTVKFENYSFPAPGNSHNYLRKIYGNYMELPNLETLRIHTTHVEIFD